MAEVDYNQLGKDILTGVGGESNVSSVVHCATRMRFRLKDRDKAAREQIEKLPGVITVVESGGQFQVVIGNNVPEGLRRTARLAHVGRGRSGRRRT